MANRNNRFEPKFELEPQALVDQMEQSAANERAGQRRRTLARLPFFHIPFSWTPFVRSGTTIRNS